MSQILRHQALELGMEVDSGGFVAVDELVKYMNGASRADILAATVTNEKKRFEIVNRDGRDYIRAVQGHNVSLAKHISEDELLERIEKPLPKCIHGTDHRALASIMKTGGLKPMSRMHVHFAQSEEASSGIRKNAPVLIYLNMRSAMLDGIPFYMSKNGVVLSPGNADGLIPVKYFEYVKS